MESLAIDASGIDISGNERIILNGDGLISTSGNMGVGTRTPTAKLQVDGNIKTTGILHGTVIKLSETSSTTAETIHRWNTKNEDIYYTNGNVAIGFDDPTVALDISGDLSCNGDVTLNKLNITANQEKVLMIKDGKIDICNNLTGGGGGNATTTNASTTEDGLLSSADKTKLDAIETAADVTDAANVAAAGAVMKDGNLSQDITGIKSFNDITNVTISNNKKSTTPIELDIYVDGGKYRIGYAFTPILNLCCGNIYRFMQDDNSNSNHPLRFYLDEAKVLHTHQM